MYLSYNGIDLRVVRTLLLSRRVKYDPTGKDYLGTVWDISVVALYTPDVATGPAGGRNLFVTATAAINGTPQIRTTGTVDPKRQPDALKPYQGVIDPNNVNHIPAYNSPVWTDAALRHRLVQPRGKLRLVFSSCLDGSLYPGTDQGEGGSLKQLWLESPSPPVGQNLPAACDLDNGPRPQVHSIQDVFGDGRLFMVTFQVQTTVNDCRTNIDGAADHEPLLSNQWTASLTYDEQYFSTRIVQGLAIFRADVVNNFLRDPSQFQLKILPPVPGNCKRFIDELTQLPDGYSFAYTVRDVEQPMTYIDRPLKSDGTFDENARPRNVTNFDIVVERTYEQMGVRQMIPRVLELEWLIDPTGRGKSFVDETEKGAMAGAKAGAKVGRILGPEGAAAGAVIGGLIGGLTPALKRGAIFANEFLPQFTETITVSVAGNRFARMQDLQYLAFSAAFGQMTSPVGIQESPLGHFAGLFQTPILGAILGVIPGAIISNLAGANLIAAGIAGLKLLPNANVWNVKFNPLKKQLQFVLVNEYAGLVDWVTGGTAGGWRGITAPISDRVVGGDWPNSAFNNYLFSGNVISQPMKVNLPPLTDLAGKELAVSTNAPGIAPPVLQNGIDSTKFYTGTGMTTIIAHKLLEECQTPGRLQSDAELVANGQDLRGPNIPVAPTGKQLFP